MTRTPKTSSYFQDIARRPANNLPLLKPPHTPMQHWESMSTQTVVGETTLSLSAQHPSTATTKSGNTLPLLQISPAQRVLEQQSTHPTQKVVEVEIAPGTVHRVSTTKPTPIVVPNTSPIIEDNTLPTRDQPSQTSTQLTSVRPIKPALATAQPSLAVDNKGQTRDSAEEHPTSVTLRPHSKHTAVVVHLESDAHLVRPTQITLVPQAQDRPTASQPKQHQKSQQTQPETSIHIGTIDIHIEPPPAPSAPAVPVPTARGTTTRTRSALSREFTSSIGLRQG